MGAVVVAVVSAVGVAQTGVHAGRSSRARGLFIKKTADGIRVKVLTASGAIVAPNRQFKAGDEIRIELESNFDGYVYVLNVEENGKRYLLFPFPGQTNNRVNSDRSYSLPRGASIQFDARPGLEVLQVIMSRDPIDFLEAALNNPACAADDEIRCPIEGTWAAPTATPDDPKKPQRGGLVASNAHQALPEGSDTARTRGITFGAGKDKSEGSFVMVADKKGNGAKLGNGQLAIFEMRLIHK